MMISGQVRDKIANSTPEFMEVGLDFVVLEE